jgi:glycosyltransferase involved in cell wall biosynthesis
MRLLNVIHSVNRERGGPAEGLRQLVLADAELGHSHEVATLDAPNAPWLADFPVPLHALGPSRLTYGYTPRLRPWLIEHAPRFDAVIVHGLWQYIGLCTRQALRPHGVPYFVFCHGMLDPWFKREYPVKHLKKWLYWPWGEYRVLRDANAVLFTAEEEAQLAAQSFWLYRARPAVVGYGLELDAAAGTADAETFLDAYPATRGKRRLLFLARIHPKKGCDLLIDAFADAAATDPALHLVMAGPDQVGWSTQLRERAARLGVADRITWCGMLTGELKWAALRAAEVFVLPSHQENFGIAVAEALALGVPVLISDKVNIWREIDAAGAGLVGADTAEGTRATLRRWLALDAAQRSAMRSSAGACFETHFRMSAAARRLIETIAPHVRPRRLQPGSCPIHSLET